MTDDRILIPGPLTADMIDALRRDPMTGPCDASIGSMRRWCSHIGWMVCALDVLEQRRQPKNQ